MRQLLTVLAVALPCSCLEADKQWSCIPLRNQDVYFTATVQVGTPPQQFDLVADTGSTTFLLQSCACQVLGSCPLSYGACFLGTDASSTFGLATEWTQLNGEPVTWSLVYGSGDIEAVAATDAVTVGNVTVQMNSSLLLMVSQTLGLDGPFQGILGLGMNIPQSKDDIYYDPPGFLTGAGIRRFSMCFNNVGDGNLQLNTEEQPNNMSVVGHYHWTLGMSGVYLEDSAGPELQISGCKAGGCSAILDSGTTFITGPQSSLIGIFASLCQRWKRCADLHSSVFAQLSVIRSGIHQEVVGASAVARPSDLTSRLADAFEQHVGDHRKWPGRRAKASQSAPELYEVFVILLQECNSWYSNETNLNDEMPSLSFHVRGAKGEEDVLRLRPTSYIGETTFDVWSWSKRHLLGIIPIWWLEPEAAYLCTPFFGHTGDENSGSDWILGVPVFYEYQVHHDMGSDPPSMAFSRANCSACKQSENAADGGSMALAEGSTGHTGLRMLRRRPRVPPIGMLESLRHHA